MQIRIPFTKMSGAGNDFVVIDNRSEILTFDKSPFAHAVCSRHFGVGADGLLIVEKSVVADFAMLYYNADGSFGGMCGNGGRCIARYVRKVDNSPDELTFESLNYVYRSEFVGASVMLHMRRPKHFRENILLSFNSNIIKATFIDTGSPHTVIVHPNVYSLDVQNLGRMVRFQGEFSPEGTNVNFVQPVDMNSMKIRTYERGVETETLACGTGAVASAIAMYKQGNVVAPVNVIVKSGETLQVQFKTSGDEFDDVTLTGSAHFLFSGILMYDTEKSVLVDSAQHLGT
jgi:diaminopimelate epimerase